MTLSKLRRDAARLANRLAAQSLDAESAAMNRARSAAEVADAANGAMATIDALDTNKRTALQELRDDLEELRLEAREALS